MGPCASSTLKGLVPRRSATDGWPVGGLRRGASVQGLAGIVGAHVRFGGREVRCAADMSQVPTGGLRNIRRACSTSMGRWLGNGSLRTAVQGCRRWRTGCCRPLGPSHGCRKRRPPRPSCFRCPASAPACWPLYLPRVATRCGGGTTTHCAVSAEWLRSLGFGQGSACHAPSGRPQSPAGCSATAPTSTGTA